MADIDAGVILKVTRTMIGETEPCGDSWINRKRTENLNKLIIVVDELLYDIEKAALCKDHYEDSMRIMGEKAHNAINEWWKWMDEYLREGEDD